MTTTAPLGRPTDHALTDRILDATVELLAEHGYARLRIEHVAARVGCGKAAIYRRYAEKAQLVAAVVRSRVEIGELPDRGNLVDDLVEHAMRNQQNQAQPELPVRTGASLLFDPEVFPHMWDTFLSRRREQGLALLQRGIVRGELPADAELDLILDTLAGLTLYRQTVKGVTIARHEYRDIVVALVDAPPRRTSDRPERPE